MNSNGSFQWAYAVVYARCHRYVTVPTFCNDTAVGSQAPGRCSERNKAYLKVPQELRSVEPRDANLAQAVGVDHRDERGAADPFLVDFGDYLQRVEQTTNVGRRTAATLRLEKE